MGDEIAGGDRQQAGRGGRQPDQARHEERGDHDEAEETGQLEGLDRDSGRSEHLEPRLGLGEPVEQDRGRPARDEDQVLDPPAGQEEPGRERASRHPALARIADEGRRGEPAEQPEPDAERLAVRPPGIAAELGHHRQRERGVADQDDEQGARPAAVADELEPDEEQQPDDRRPAAEGARVLGDRPTRDTDATGDGRADVVDRRERVEPVPDRTDERGQEREPDPAVDPQEERRHIAGAGAARDPLGDDPGPADQADGAEEVAQRGGRDPARGRDRRLRPDIGDEEERERQPHGDPGSREVDDQRQPALVGVREGVGRHDRRTRQD